MESRSARTVGRQPRCCLPESRLCLRPTLACELQALAAILATARAIRPATLRQSAPWAETATGRHSRNAEPYLRSLRGCPVSSFALAGNLHDPELCRVETNSEESTAERVIVSEQ